MLRIGAFWPLFNLIEVPCLCVHPYRAAKRETRQLLEQVFSVCTRQPAAEQSVVRSLISSSIGCATHRLNFYKYIEIVIC